FHESSPMNPGFFAYGSFPLYLLAVSGWLASAFDPQYATYDGLNLVGRVLSAFFDTATILCIFGITRQLFSSKKSSNNDDSAVWLALIAALLYCVCVLPIQ